MQRHQVVFKKRFKRELCVVCSAGGHLSEALSAIAKADADTYFVTKRDEHVASRIKNFDVCYVNDPHTSIMGFIINGFKSLLIFLKQRPEIVLSTGSGIALATCMLGKLYGSKIIYIESGARVVAPSKTGKFMYKYADVFYVQWKSMLKVYPDAIYVGGLI